MNPEHAGRLGAMILAGEDPERVREAAAEMTPATRSPLRINTALLICTRGGKHSAYTFGRAVLRIWPDERPPEVRLDHANRSANRWTAPDPDAPPGAPVSRTAYIFTCERCRTRKGAARPYRVAPFRLTAALLSIAERGVDLDVSGLA